MLMKNNKKQTINYDDINIGGDISNLEPQIEPAPQDLPLPKQQIERTTLLKELIKRGDFEGASKFLDAYKKGEDLLKTDYTPELLLNRYMSRPYDMQEPLINIVGKDKQVEEATPINLVRENIAQMQQSREFEQKVAEEERRARNEWKRIMIQGKLGGDEISLARNKNQINSLMDEMEMISNEYDIMLAASRTSAEKMSLLKEKQETLKPYIDRLRQLRGEKVERNVKKVLNPNYKAPPSGTGAEAGDSWVDKIKGYFK